MKILRILTPCRINPMKADVSTFCLKLKFILHTLNFTCPLGFSFLTIKIFRCQFCKHLPPEVDVRSRQGYPDGTLILILVWKRYYYSDDFLLIKGSIVFNESSERLWHFMTFPIGTLRMSNWFSMLKLHFIQHFTREPRIIYMFDYIHIRVFKKFCRQLEDSKYS